MKKLYLFSALLIFCFSAVSQKSDTTTLNLLNPTYPSSFIFTDKGCWNQTYNEVNYNPFTSQIFSFTHNIEGAGSCYGGYAWSGFTVCNSGDNTNHSTQGWAMNYEWGCMAGGGIKTDNEGNIMIDGNGDVIVEKGVPYLVSYWKFMIDPLWWHLGFGNTFINAPVHSLKIILNNEKEYEAVGVYVNNHPWTYYSNKYGDYARPLNQEGDYVKLFFHGLHPDGTESGKSVEFLLAKYEDGQLYQNEKWEWLDLSSLGVIGGIYCTMETTVCSSTGGPQSPTYFCMDKLQVRTTETIIHIPVTDIVNVPTVVGVGEPLTLTGTVIPTDATFQNIVWSVKDAGDTGATILGDTLYTTKTGTVILTASIKDGLDFGLDFKKDFTIIVEEEIITYKIMATVNHPDFGTINPIGEVFVEQGETIVFYITAFDKYIVSEVIVNDTSKGKLDTYTFENVQSDGTISVIFEEEVRIDERDFSNINIYSNKNYIYIKNVETQLIASLQTIEIYDLSGRLVYQGETKDVETVIPLPVVSGIYNVVLYDKDAAHKCRDAINRFSTRVLIVND